MNPTLAIIGALVLSFYLGYWFGQRSLRAYKNKMYRELYRGNFFRNRHWRLPR